MQLIYTNNFLRERETLGDRNRVKAGVATEAEPGLIWPQTGNTFSLGLPQISVSLGTLCIWGAGIESLLTSRSLGACDLEQRHSGLSSLSRVLLCDFTSFFHVSLLPLSFFLISLPSLLHSCFSSLCLFSCSSPLFSASLFSAGQAGVPPPSSTPALVSSYENKWLVLGLVLDFFLSWYLDKIPDMKPPSEGRFPLLYSLRL